MLRHLLFTTSLNDQKVTVERHRHVWLSHDAGNLPLTADEARLLAKALSEQADALDADNGIFR